MENEASVESKPELTPAQKFKAASDAYWKAVQSGDKVAAAKIHSDNNLPYSVGNHS